MSLSDKSSRFPLPAATSPPHHYHQQHHTAGWEQRSATVIPAAAVRCSGSQWLKWVWQSHRSLVLQCDPVEIDVTANWLELNVKKRHKHSSKCLSCPNPLIELISDLRLWCVCRTKRTRLFNYWIVSVGWQTGWKINQFISTRGICKALNHEEASRNTLHNQMRQSTQWSWVGGERIFYVTQNVFESRK